MRLVLVRHGETEWNTQQRYQGHQAIPLNDHGRWQAAQAAERLIDYAVQAVYASDIARAWETATIIGEVLQLPVQPLTDFREINDGLWAGRTPTELDDLYPDHMSEYRAAPATTQRLQGESYAQVQQRMWTGFMALAERHAQQTVVAVSHGGAIRALVCALLEAPLEHWKRLWIENGAFVEIVAHSDGYWRIMRLNDVAHLHRSAFAQGE